MPGEKSYKPLNKQQIQALESQNCTACDWSKVLVSHDFETSCVKNANFLGQVKLTNLSGNIKTLHAIEKPCGIYNATLSNCSIADNTRIANVTVHIADYDIAENVCIENVAVMQTNPGATFGNGVEVEVLNEAGGREVTLFDHLSVQFAYMMCLHRYRPDLIEKLKNIAAQYVDSVRSDRGKVDAGAQIYSAGQIIDVNIGPFAVINGTSSLVNGTILSAEDASTTVGYNVNAKDFIFAESSSVTDAAILVKTFIGQGCRIGKQFSAENSLFFANSEAYHGEACNVFAGPYTVTHHKSSLLIAGLFSFYNAGSGTNQSNHMYKLGPCHEGKLLRGTKTGSFSYMMWPCVTGPFSIVLGKHTGTFDTADYPFSHHEARPDGKCAMIPGLHLTTVGTVRDGQKWPNRDRRKGAIKRDIISFDIFSPYTVGKMLTASIALRSIYESTEKAVEEVSLGGALVRRPILRTAQKYYRTGIEMYLLEKVIEKTELALQNNKSLADAFNLDTNAVYSQKWLDIGGQLMPKKRLDNLETDIQNGKITSPNAIYEQLNKIQNAYAIDEWAWVKDAYEKYFDFDLSNASKDHIADAAQKLLKVKSKFFNLVIADAEKEFAQLSQTGFGQDATETDTSKDFDEVRGLYEQNKFVIQMKQNVQKLQQRVKKMLNQISNSK
jgi:hypothetical protein